MSHQHKLDNLRGRSRQRLNEISDVFLGKAASRKQPDVDTLCVLDFSNREIELNLLTDAFNAQGIGCQQKHSMAAPMAGKPGRQLPGSGYTRDKPGLLVETLGAATELVSGESDYVLIIAPANLESMERCYLAFKIWSLLENPPTHIGIILTEVGEPTVARLHYSRLANGTLQFLGWQPAFFGSIPSSAILNLNTLVLDLNQIVENIVRQWFPELKRLNREGTSNHIQR